jgi:PEP-CTERM motif
MRAFVAASAGLIALALAASPAHAKNDKPKNDNPPASPGKPNKDKDNGNGGGPAVFVMTPCADYAPAVGAFTCTGWFEGNLNAEGLGPGTLDARLARATGLNDLVDGSPFDAATLVPLAKYDTSGPTIDFGQKLYGVTIVGFHVGGANGAGGIGYSGTAFYKFDAGTAGLSSFQFKMPGLSNAALYSTGAIPEPATWAMMILGFGAVGSLLRRRRLALG